MADDPGTGQAVQAPPGAQIPETQPLEIPRTSTSASRRVRARLARRMTAQRSAVNPVLEPLVAVHKGFVPKANLALLQKAYEVAEERHAGANVACAAVVLELAALGGRDVLKPLPVSSLHTV